MPDGCKLLHVLAHSLRLIGAAAFASLAACGSHISSATAAAAAALVLHKTAARTGFVTRSTRHELCMHLMRIVTAVITTYI